MPMKTMFVRRPSPPSTRPSRMSAAAVRTCSTISPTDRFRSRPPWPVAQNGQAMPQPAWEEMHNVARSGYRMSTDSSSVPSWRRHSVFRVSPPSQEISLTGVMSCGNSASRTLSRVASGRSVIERGSAASRP